MYFVRALPAAALIAACTAHAGGTDISNTPLSNASTTSVPPNVMFILDDSASMQDTNMPSETGGGNAIICNKKCVAASCTVDTIPCAEGDPPFYAYAFNTIYYNPQITWLPGVDSTGASLGNASPTAAKVNPYVGGATVDLLKDGVAEFIYCNIAAPTAAQKNNNTICKRNGIDTPAAGFAYSTTVNAAPFGGGFPTTGFIYRVPRYTAGSINNNPYYFDITPREHCTDVNMQVCAAYETPTGIYIVPAPVRWCRRATGADSADSAAPVTGNGAGPTATTPASPLCQAKVTATYMYPRLGTLKRVDIVPAI
ncbi:MAG: hypothetical protein ACREIB_02515, partial [Pseudomonadota bacterium]